MNRPFVITRESGFLDAVKDNLKYKFTAGSNYGSINVVYLGYYPGKIFNEISNVILSSYIYKYENLYSEIMDKYHNNLSTMAGIYIMKREMDKRQNDIDTFIQNTLDNTTEDKLKKVEKAMKNIKGNMFKLSKEDEDMIFTYYEAIPNIRDQAKEELPYYHQHEDVRRGKLKLSNIMLNIYLIREILKKQTKSKEGKKFLDYIKDLERFINRNMEIYYESESKDFNKTVII